ncbi:MAG: two-component regulator propeller domain-containing protein, partial [Ferruginibacter sp.]
IDNFHLLNDDEFLLTTHSGMQKINIRTGQPISWCPFPAGQLIADYSLTTSLQTSSSTFLVGVNNQLWEYDVLQNRFTHELTDAQGHSFFSANLYSSLIKDKYNNIWAASYIQGLRKIHYRVPAIKYYGLAESENNFIKCIYADKKNNLVLCGTLNHGLQVYDTSQRLIKHFTQFEKNITQPTVSAIEKVNDDEYVVFPYNKGGIYIFNRKKLSIKRSTVSFPFSWISFNYYFNAFRNNDSSFIGCVLNVIYRFTQRNNTIWADSISVISQMDNFFTFQHSNGAIWLAGKGRYAILQPSAKTWTFFPIRDNVMVRCMAEDKQHNVWLATETGLYKTDDNGKIIKQFSKKDGLPDEGIYAVAVDDDENVWFSHNKGFSRISSNGSLLNLSKQDGLQENEFNTNSVFKTTNGEFFFGGVNGVNSFYPSDIRSLKKAVKLFVTSVASNGKRMADTSFWNLSFLSFTYKNNDLSFEFVAQGPRNPDQYVYQYKVAGLSNRWISNGNNSSLSLLFPPGEYDLQLAAGDEFDENAIPQKQIHLVIYPPFWLTAWFYTVTALLIAGLIWWLARFMARRKLREQLRQMETEKKLQQERERISRDLHDNLGTYATALLMHTNQVKPNVESDHIVEKIRDDAKEIMSSLRETIWVLNNRQMSVTDFADGFKLYAKKIMNNFPELKIEFREKIENNKILSPNTALNLYRILQEALQNAVKYAGENKIEISICSNHKVEISITDGGVGFDPEEKGFGNGLHNMEHRAKETGYKFEIISSPGEGTKVSLSEK